MCPAGLDVYRYEEIAGLLDSRRSQNRAKIRSRMRAFEADMVLIPAEVLVLVIALSFNRWRCQHGHPRGQSLSSWQ